MSLVPSAPGLIFAAVRLCGESDHGGLTCDRAAGHDGDCVASRGTHDTLLWTGKNTRAALPPLPSCRRCGERTKQYHDAAGQAVYLVGVCVRCRIMTDGASDGGA